MPSKNAERKPETYRVPMSSPDLSPDDVRAVNEVLETPFLSMGPKIEAFERGFAEYIGERHAVGVSSGTSGLHLCVLAAGVGEGDLVLTTPFSFVASANVLLYERAVPIFVDIDPQTMNLDPRLLWEAAAALSGSGKEAQPWLPRSRRGKGVGPLKAVLPIHAFGQPADMDSILQVARTHDLVLIEDACEAIGAEYKGRMAGTFGEAAVFAFYPNKQITTGEGGMIVTDREDWNDLLRSLRNQGRDVLDAWLNHSRLGYNYRLDEMSAALGLAQLSRIEELLAKRKRVAKWYNERLGSLERVEVPYLAPSTSRMSWFVYVVRMAEGIDRDLVMKELEARGIPSRPYFSPIHLQPYYSQRFGYRQGDFPVAEKAARATLALPFSGVMSETQVELVCENLEAVLGTI